MAGALDTVVTTDVETELATILATTQKLPIEKLLSISPSCENAL